MLKYLKSIKTYALAYIVASALLIIWLSSAVFTEEILKEYQNSIGVFSLSGIVYNVGIDSLGALVCAALYYGCMKQKGDGSRIFRILTILVCTCFTVNELTVLTAFKPEQTVYFFIFSLLSKIIDLALIYLFYLYVRATLGFEGKFANIVHKILPVLLGLQTALLLLNIFFPLTFEITAAGIYQETDMSLLEELFLAVASISTTVLIIESHSPRNQKAAVLTFIFLPIIEYVVMLEGNFGEASQYAIVLMSLIIMYCVVFNYNNNKLAATETELNMATEIQTGMLPSIFPAFPGRPEFDIHASMDPAKEVGGDFYDFLMIDDDHVALVIADVSGKGVPAALFMMSSKIFINDHAAMGGSPAEILERVNKLICANNEAHMFVTVWLGILEISTGRLTTASAGHEYPIINQNGKYEIFKDVHGLAIGATSRSKYTDTEIMLKKGDSIFVYTDGVAEATDAGNQMFGTDRTVDALNSIPADATQKDVLAGVRTAVDAFVKGAPQFDDLTMLGLKYFGPTGNT